MTTILKEEFDQTTVATIVSGVEGQQIKIVGITITNNDATESNYTKVRLISSSPTTDLYGSIGGSVFLTGDGGMWSLPVTHQSVRDPYFECNEGGDFIIASMQSKRISGAVWYFIE